MPYQLELTATQVSNLIEALEFYARFQWGQVAHLPLSLECSERTKHLQRDQIEEALLPFRQLVWPELRGWGHNLGIGWKEGQAERQAAQIAWEMSRTILTARNNHVNVASLYSSNWPVHLSPEPLPRLTWVGDPVAPTATPAQQAALDALNGFRSFQFGDKLIQHAGELQFQNAVGPHELYRRVADDLIEQGLQVKSIDYVFAAGKLSSVSVSLMGKTNSDRMRAALEVLYGPAEEHSIAPGNCFWHGRQVIVGIRAAALGNEEAILLYAGRGFTIHPEGEEAIVA